MMSDTNDYIVKVMSLFFSLDKDFNFPFIVNFDDFFDLRFKNAILLKIKMCCVVFDVFKECFITEMLILVNIIVIEGEIFKSHKRSWNK